MPHCLIIDRSPISLKAAGGVFDRLGYIVEKIQQFPDPILSEESQMPEVVLVDVALVDGQHGHGSIAKLRRAMPDAYIMLMLKRHDPNFMRLARNEGADDIITKPYTVDDFTRRFASDRIKEGSAALR